jgi:serine/threonine protein kinase
MPFDDSNIRKLVRYQLEKKIHFSRYKPLSNECKQLILSLLEPDIQLRATIFQIKNHDWIKERISSILNHDSSKKSFLPTGNNTQESKTQ